MRPIGSVCGVPDPRSRSLCCTPLLALAWVAAAGVLTFRTASVFTVACNGFFSVYFGLFLSVSLFAKVHLFSSRVEPPVDDVLSAA